MPHQLFVYFPDSRRWLPATPIGAHTLAVDAGHDVYYGIVPPRRPGVRVPWHLTGAREWAWQTFTRLIARQPFERRRLSATFIPLN